MPSPASVRLWGSCLGYLGMLIALFFIARSIWQMEGMLPNGSVIDVLSQVRPVMWLLIPIAGLPGFLIHLVGDRMEARQKGISMREVQFARHLRWRHPGRKNEPESH